jgi:hypothetical protein
LQVAISFPAANFTKSDYGTSANLVDDTSAGARYTLRNGVDVASAVRRWIIEDWLEANDTVGL